MKILLVHNYYKQRGGEDVSFESEAAMLRDFGHQVKLYTRNNQDIDRLSKTSVALQSTWSTRTLREIGDILGGFRADVVHCTNLFPLISPSVYDAAHAFKVPVIQSLRNYRQMCLNSLFFREGTVCESCSVRTLAWPGIRHKCYRGSRIGSAVVAASNGFHKLRGTWRHRIDRFFTPTEFTRRKFIENGFPADKIAVKPNFLTTDPGASDEERQFALFVGRLSPEKGLHTLLSVWNQLQLDLPLRIAGGGPLKEFTRNAAANNRWVSYEGELPHDEITAMIGRAKFLVMPSEWYETFGRTLMEAFSRATPVIASRLGAMDELVDGDRNGLTFEPGDEAQLRECVMRLATDEDLRQRLGAGARSSFLERYTAEANHRIILKIYTEAIVAKQTDVAYRKMFDPKSA